MAGPSSPSASMPSCNHLQEHTNLLILDGIRPPQSCVQILAALENTRSAAQLVPKTARSSIANVERTGQTALFVFQSVYEFALANQVGF